MDKHSEFIHGTCQQLLFSPKGAVEGALISMKGSLVQVSASSGKGVALAQATGPGRQLRVLAVPDRSPKAADGAHSVFKFKSFADVAGKAIKASDAEHVETTIKGVVSAWHFARHGEPNGVMLATGEFIHLRPQGVAAAGLDIGSKVNAVGKLGMTALGTRMLEAHRVNRVDLT
ncbi:hypothetical protein [Roseateles sp.]|uniref:hypothetical protein n=1 Tax=Roseateles sp. TaxID=1971397 RepID=UPI003265BF44